MLEKETTENDKLKTKIHQWWCSRTADGVFLHLTLLRSKGQSGQKMAVFDRPEQCPWRLQVWFYITESFQIFCRNVLMLLLILLYMFFVSPAHNMVEAKHSYKVFLGTLVIQLTVEWHLKNFQIVDRTGKWIDVQTDGHH